MTNNCGNVTTGTASTQPESGAASSVLRLDQGPSTSAVQQTGSKRADKSQDGKHTRMQRLSAGFQAMLKLVSAFNLFGFKAPQASKPDPYAISPFDNSHEPEPLAALTGEEAGSCTDSDLCAGGACAALPGSPAPAETAGAKHSNGDCLADTPLQPAQQPQQQQLLLLPASNGQCSPGKQPAAVLIPDAIESFSSSAALVPLPPHLMASFQAAAPVPRHPGAHTTTSVRAIITTTRDAYASASRSGLAQPSMNGAPSSCSSIGLDEDHLGPEGSSSFNSLPGSFRTASDPASAGSSSHRVGPELLTAGSSSFRAPSELLTAGSGSFRIPSELLSAGSSRRASMLGDSGRASRRGSLVLDMGPPSPGPNDAEASPAPWWSRPVTFGAHHDQSKREHMEDRTQMVDLSAHEAFVKEGVRRAGFFAVYDGHAGAEASEYLQLHLLSHVLAAPELLEAPGNALAAAVEAAEREIVQQFAAARCNAGSTLLAVLLLDKELHVAHVGDCRAVLARGTEATPLTSDHKPQSEAERARIEAADPGAWISGDGYLYDELAVSRAVGSQHLKLDPSKRALTHVPEVLSRVLEKEDDFLVLATDGLWDKVDNAEAVSTARRILARERGGAEASAKALVERALNYKSGDNISVVVVCLHDRAISMPKTNSMLFRKLNAEGRCGTPNSSTGLDTPAGCSTPGFSTPVLSTTPRERSSSSSTPGDAVVAAAQANGSGVAGGDDVPGSPAAV